MKILQRAVLTFLLLTISNCSQNSKSNEVLDLSGQWELKLLRCNSVESVCQKKYSDLKTVFSVNLPQNLHQQFPEFYGLLEFRKIVVVSQDSNLERLQTLLLGSIGSADITYLNNIPVGYTGNFNEHFSFSSWNKVRAYSIPPGVLKFGQNEIRILVNTLDAKGGIHAGPIAIGSHEELIESTFFQTFSREYVFIAIPFLVFLVLILLVFTTRYWRREEGNIYLVIAFIGYLIHSIYFIPFPLFLNYTASVQLLWIMRLVSVFGTAMYFVRSFGIRDRVPFIISAGCLVFASLHLIWQNDLYSTFSAIKNQYLVYIFLLLLPPVYAGKKYFSYGEFRMQFAGTIMVLLTYSSDFVMLLTSNDFPWLYHYFSVVSVFHFLYFFSYHLYLWRERGRQQGLNDAEINYLKEKLQMANELHDIVGSQLTQIVAGTENSKTEHSSLHQLAVSSLDKVRSFAHILKGEDNPKDLPDLIFDYARRLHGLQRYELKIILNKLEFSLSKNESFCFSEAELASFNRTADDKNENISLNIDNFTLLQIDRILSEWVANVVRHANPEKIGVGYKIRNSTILVFIWQNATAFYWNGSASRGGLSSIAWRCKNLNAQARCRKFQGGAIFLLRMPNYRKIW